MLNLLPLLNLPNRLRAFLAPSLAGLQHIMKNIPTRALHSLATLGTAMPRCSASRPAILSRAVLLLAGMFALGSGLRAQLYFDPNGTTAGSGVTNGGSDVWTTANGTKRWTTNSAGAATGGESDAWTNGNSATFSAAADATGFFTLTLGVAITVANITVEEGNYTIGGGTGTLALSAASTVDVVSGLSLSISAPLGGAFSLTKTGLGTLTLSGATTYSGGTGVNAGTLALGASGAILSTSSVSVNGGTFNLNTFNNTLATVTLSSGTISGSTGTLTVSSLALQSGVASAKIAGASAAVTKTTGGTATLSGANTHGGGTTVSAGTLVLGSTTALGSGNVSLAGGTLNVNGQTVTTAGALSLAAATSSTLDFGLGAGATSLNFSLGTIDGTVNVTNYDVGDHIYLTSIVGIAASQFVFIDPLGNTGTYYAYLLNSPSGGYTELTPDFVLGAIPEPATFALFAGLGMLGLAVWKRNRSKSLAR